MKSTLVFIIIVLVAFTSCRENELAKKADGTWYMVLDMKNDEGTPYTEERIYTFNYDENADVFGGTFTEQNIDTMPEEEIDDFIISYTSTTTINGNWEVIAGGLYLTYNLSSLEVSIDDIDIKLSDDLDLLTYMSYTELAMGNALLGQDLINEKAIAKDLRKGIYQDAYELYEANNYLSENNNYCYTDLTIEDDIMVFTGEEGTAVLKKLLPTTSEYEEENHNGNQDDDYVTNTDMKGTKNYHGYINKNLEVTVTLTFEKPNKGIQEVYGYYYYHKNGENHIILKGNYNPSTQRLNLTEYYDDGTPNCKISALKESEGFNGKFTTPQGKEMTFSISLYN